MDGILDPFFGVEGHSHIPIFLAEGAYANISGNRICGFGLLFLGVGLHFGRCEKN